MVLLLHRAEHNADRACAQAHQDEHRDELGPAVGRQGLHRGDVVHQDPCAWGASDAVRQDVAADEARQRRALLAGADAGKSVGPEPDVRALDAFLPALQLVAEEQPDGAAPYTPGAGPSGARSCAAQEAAARLVALDEAYSVPPEQTVALKLKSLAPEVRAEPRQQQAAEVAQLRDAAGRQQQVAPEARAALAALRAFRPQV